MLPCNEGALGSACALRGLVALWQGQCRQLEVQLRTSAQAAAAAKRTVAADMAALSSDIAHSEQRLQAAQQLERQLRQRQVLLEVSSALILVALFTGRKCQQLLGAH